MKEPSPGGRAPNWLQHILKWPDIDWPEPISIRLWLIGDENRLLPMPLRYAATHPCSASAIIRVLKGNN